MAQKARRIRCKNLIYTLINYLGFSHIQYSNKKTKEVELDIYNYQ